MTIDYKDRIRRLRAGGRPRVLDLFSGCGGLSVGLQRAGCEIVAGLDSDRSAMETWYYNLRPDLLPHLHRTPAWDIKAVEPYGFFSDLRIAEGVDSIDIMCGGPPCQAYSRIGKGKLRSLGGVDALLSDERGNLYEDFLRFVGIVKPLAVLIENVPDSANFGGENIPEEICRQLNRSGYTAVWTLLNAAEFGVPQARQRVFILAVHQSVSAYPLLPPPTHRIVRPDNVRVVQDMAEIFATKLRAGETKHYLMPLAADTGLLSAIGAEAALDDLPRIRPLSLASGAKLCQDPRILSPYGIGHPTTDYQHIMRHWPALETSGWVSGNALRNNRRDFPIFQRMNEGDQYPDAIRIAEQRLSDFVSAEQRRLRRDPTPTELATYRKKIVPPYATDKFEGKWTKLRRHQPSHTIVAHLQYDTYSHIHYDSDQARGITVREAARLQSFPDGFRFLGSMKEAFRQIGNAVPPLLADALGRQMIAALYGSAEASVPQSARQM